jgi:hydrogenase maturation protease
MLPVLVLGIGNILLRDEGVGVRAVEELRGVPLPEDVELVDGGTCGADLVELLADRRKVIVIDALQTDEPPGSVFRLTAAELMPSPGDCISLHQLGLVESLNIAAQLGCAPEEVVIFGIQPGTIAPGLELTAEAAAAIPLVIRSVLAELTPAKMNSEPGRPRPRQPIFIGSSCIEAHEASNEE